MNGIFYIYLEYFNRENNILGVKNLFMVYDDEKLSPQIYEKMAKEYSKTLKQNVNVALYKEDDIIKKENIEKLNNYYFNIFNNLTILKTYKKNISQIDNIFLMLKDYAKSVECVLKDKKQKCFFTNYCNNISEIIKDCSKSIKSLILLCDYNTKIDASSAITSLCDIIRNVNYLYGICTYRQ